MGVTVTNRYLLALTFLLTIGAGVLPAEMHAQVAPAPRARAASQKQLGPFSGSEWHVGPRMWFAGMNDADVSFGLQAERPISGADDPEEGAFGLFLAFDTYSQTYVTFTGLAQVGIPDGSVKGRHWLGAVGVNYHFRLSNPKWDPFIGLGVGYGGQTVSGEAPGATPLATRAKGVFFTGQLGVRYFLTERVGAYGQFGTGVGNLGAGISLKF